MKIKIFSDENHRQLQADVQAWLDHHPQASITTILQSESWVAVEGGAWSLTITIFYIE